MRNTKKEWVNYAWTRHASHWPLGLLIKVPLRFGSVSGKKDVTATFSILLMPLSTLNTSHNITVNHSPQSIHLRIMISIRFVSCCSYGGCCVPISVSSMIEHFVSSRVQSGSGRIVVEVVGCLVAFKAAEKWWRWWGVEKQHWCNWP